MWLPLARWWPDSNDRVAERRQSHWRPWFLWKKGNQPWGDTRGKRKGKQKI